MSLICRGLGGLPVEIIQRIASIGPCESAKSFVMHAMTGTSSKPSLQIVTTAKGPDWPTVALSSDAPTSSWGRYALADSKARRWEAEYPPCRFQELMDVLMDVDELEDEFLRWAPQLMAASRENSKVADIGMVRELINFSRSRG